MDRVRVVLADDHVLFRRGLEVVLDADERVEIVGQASDGTGVVELASTLRPDVAILDVRMPGMDGIEACRRIRSALPGTRVLLLTGSEDEADLLAAVRAGAEGYLLKDGDPAEVGDAIVALSEGRSLVPPEIAARLLVELAGVDGAGPSGPLTPRERDVLALVARGMRNREIAGELFIAENTVKNHVRSILTKLGMTSRVEAAAYAIRTGLARRP